ncbi:hypothetical protein [Mucilaginibacter paludis]|uniref:Uncharacterized protein n=1 Tax=Mucilaginibacter paludis DSM 18603 TaxID=714943 RepID=H1Y0E9_9SPHI|nr:hypothetical protein [Mucilaginibacter paludis]EHQ28198.1 hypothetical protein Mucpa_4107 [Mucilaginibacter paludis DSM 18603]
MKYIVITLIIWVKLFAAFSQNFPQKQISIPLSNQKGVPFAIGNEIKDYYIDGFEIDDKGDFYFLGGSSTICLAKFSGSKLVYQHLFSKNITIGSQLFFKRDTLYSYNSEIPHTTSLINPSNGQLLKKYKSKDKEDINSFRFLPDGIVVESYGKSPVHYYLYDLIGDKIKEVPNKYNLPFMTPSSLSPWATSQFIGMWNDKFVFYSRRIDSNNMKDGFFTTDSTGKILQQKVILDYLNTFGQTFAESPPEFRKIRNGNLYVLGRKGKLAMITEIPLATFFSPQ